MCIGDVNLRCTIFFEDKIDRLISLDARSIPWNAWNWYCGAEPFLHCISLHGVKFTLVSPTTFADAQYFECKATRRGSGSTSISNRLREQLAYQPSDRGLIRAQDTHSASNPDATHQHHRGASKKFSCMPFAAPASSARQQSRHVR